MLEVRPCLEIARMGHFLFRQIIAFRSTKQESVIRRKTKMLLNMDKPCHYSIVSVYKSPIINSLEPTPPHSHLTNKSNLDQLLNRNVQLRNLGPGILPYKQESRK